MASGDKKYGRNKIECARYKNENRAQINKEKRIAKHNTEQQAHALAKKEKHTPSHGAARDYRRNVAAYIQPNKTPDHTRYFTVMQHALLKAVK